MRAVQEDREWQTKYVKNDQPCDTYKARDVLRMIAESTYFCGDPGMQYDTTINDWHTCSNTARINASNPCSEYMGDLYLLRLAGWRSKRTARRWCATVKLSCW